MVFTPLLLSALYELFPVLALIATKLNIKTINMTCWNLVFLVHFSWVIHFLPHKAQILRLPSKVTRFSQTSLQVSSLWLSSLLYLTPWQLAEVEFLLLSTGGFVWPDPNNTRPVIGGAEIWDFSEMTGHLLVRKQCRATSTPLSWHSSPP